MSRYASPSPLQHGVPRSPQSELEFLPLSGGTRLAVARFQDAGSRTAAFGFARSRTALDGQTAENAALLRVAEQLLERARTGSN